tara:strand:+ start:671 stop:1795 length:1125 start_codon:yes stop_codon:yes gene_type:complete
MSTSRADLHLDKLVKKYPELCTDINFLNIRRTPKEINSSNLNGANLSNFKFNIKERNEDKKSILFAHFSPFKYEIEGLGLPLYASRMMPNSKIHVTYDKGKKESVKFEIVGEKLRRINSLEDSYDVIIARSSVLSNMMNREDESIVVNNSRYSVNIKTMSYKPNYVYADRYFKEEELCPTANPHLVERSSIFLSKFTKKNIILITGSLWHVKTQLSFFQQVDTSLLDNFDVVVVGPEKELGYVIKIENECRKRGIDPYIIGNVSEDFLINLYCLSKVHLITMDMRVFGQPEGCPRVLGEGIASRCLTVCNKPVTIPNFWKDSCIVYDYEKKGDLDRALKQAIRIASSNNFIENWPWPDFSFEDQCEEILKKCVE